MVLYLACTPDKYELPVFVCDTAEEMAAYMGMSKQSIWQMVSRKRKYDRDGKPGNGGKAASLSGRSGREDACLRRMRCGIQKAAAQSDVLLAKMPQRYGFQSCQKKKGGKT